MAAAGKHDAAAVEYQVLSDIDPTDIKAGMKLAHHLAQAGQGARAADEYLRLALLYARLGHERRAMTVALRALHLDSSRVVLDRLAPLVVHLGADSIALCERVARTHLLTGRGEQARDVLSVLVQVDPGSLSKRLRLAELDLALGRMREAMNELRIVADGLRAHGRTAELIRVLEMMHTHGGADEAALRELTMIYLRCGQLRRARAKLTALHHMKPDDRLTLERLARVQARLGCLNLSLDTLETLLRLVAAQCDRREVRAVLQRAESWSSEHAYQQAIDSLGLLSWSFGKERKVPDIVAKRRPPRPPAPAAAPEIIVLDETTELEFLTDDGLPLGSGVVVQDSGSEASAELVAK
ncbi:MAG: hypothetical protein AAF799_22700 [Myxococcota bacterium]